MDVDPAGLMPPQGIDILGSSSDHLVVDAGQTGLKVGAEVAFQVNYSALIRAMASPFVTKLAYPVPDPNSFAAFPQKRPAASEGRSFTPV